MRLFVAVYPPPSVTSDLAAALAPLGVGRAAAAGVNVRLAPVERLHLTLVFLGEVPDHRLDDVTTSVKAAITEADPPPFALRLGGAGRFGRGRFTILWTGLRGDVPALTAVGRAVRRRLKRARLPFDAKPLRPHVTVARPGDRLPAEDVAADLAALADYEGPQWTVNELRLVRSHPGPTPTYDHVASFSW